MDFYWLVYYLKCPNFSTTNYFFKRGSFVYHHWICTSIYWPLYYSFRSLPIPTPNTKLLTWVFKRLTTNCSYRRGNFVYHHWVCTSIYWPLSYPFRSLRLYPRPISKYNNLNFSQRGILVFNQRRETIIRKPIEFLLFNQLNDLFIIVWLNKVSK